MTDKRIETGLTAVLVCCALTVTALAVRREIGTRSPTAPAGMVSRVEDWKQYQAGRLVSYASTKTLQTPHGRPVSVVVFSDYECPACKLLTRELPAAINAAGVPVEVRYRNFPLPIHPHARIAALTAECAAQEGRFQEMHDVLFAAADSLGSRTPSRLASQAGINDTSAFLRCLQDSTVIAQIRTDEAAGAALGVAGTPTLLINETKVRGVPPHEILTKLLVDAAR